MSFSCLVFPTWLIQQLKLVIGVSILSLHGLVADALDVGNEKWLLVWLQHF